MPSYLPFLIAFAFILISGAYKGFARPGAGALEPDDFYVGVEASLASLFLLLEPVWDGSSPFVEKQPWVPGVVGLVGLLSATMATMFARQMASGPTRAKYWSCWVAGNLFGLGCAVFTVWAKWPVAQS